jgi:hypothetical protein
MRTSSDGRTNLLLERLNDALAYQNELLALYQEAMVQRIQLRTRLRLTRERRLFHELFRPTNGDGTPPGRRGLSFSCPELGAACIRQSTAISANKSLFRAHPALSSATNSLASSSASIAVGIPSQFIPKRHDNPSAIHRAIGAETRRPFADFHQKRGSCLVQRMGSARVVS